ncbi:MAG: hypothetical protein P4L03_05495 [Terracidiphilus sp.]|nr:hypothetical protein [Terracidiphilus sp.]
MTSSYLSALGSFLLVATSLFAQSGATLVQIDVSSVLNDRVVFTQHEGQLQPAQHSLNVTDGSALITKGAAVVAQSGELTALPDNDLIPANIRHPSIQLHYAQTNGGAQVHRTTARTETYGFPVTPQCYGQVQLIFASANGETPLVVQLYYSDGTVAKISTTVPDFYFLPNGEDLRWFALVSDFGKVNLKGKMTETTHHYLHGFDLRPDPTKKLLKIEIVKQESNSVLNFFGATGLVAASGSHCTTR